MTPALRIDDGELPSTAGVRTPRTRLLTVGRPAAQALIRRWYNLELHGAERVPATGPVVMASNHVGWIDGPLLAICSPRPVHALTKQEMFAKGLGGFLLASGQIPLDRFHVDVKAIRIAVRSLREGLAVGVFPEGTRGAGDMTSPRAGAAYLALVTGAPVVPVSFLGSRVPGGSDGSIPPRGSRVAMTFGEPVHLEPLPWPRTQQQVDESARAVTAAILQTIREAEQTTGMTLPGPLGPKREKKKA
jgi:1-acyl-sn-glycerol-3-phosphate acyltransferase